MNLTWDVVVESRKSFHLVSCKNILTLQLTTFDSPSVYKPLSVRPLLALDVPAKSLKLLPYM